MFPPIRHCGCVAVFLFDSYYFSAPLPLACSQLEVCEPHSLSKWLRLIGSLNFQRYADAVVIGLVMGTGWEELCL